MTRPRATVMGLRNENLLNPENPPPAIASARATRDTAASSGEKTVEQARRNKPDLLLPDMVMEPGLDVLDTFRRILAFHPGRRAVITGGFSEAEQVAYARRFGPIPMSKSPTVSESSKVPSGRNWTGREPSCPITIRTLKK